MSIEDFLANKIDRERPRARREQKDRAPSVMEQAHAKAEKIFASPDYSIQSASFIDLYGKENVLGDMAIVKKVRTETESTNTPEQKEAKKIADVFEAVVLENSELSNWFGENSTVLKTALYDDYVNKVDMIAEWIETEREPHVLALAVDVTFGARNIERKLENVRRDIDSGELGTIKYFKNSDGSLRGERRNVPRVVIGISKQTVQELAELWIKGDKKALATHPIQHVLIEEMHHQMKAAQSYALGRGQTEVAEAYRRSLVIIEKIRGAAPAPLAKLENDKVFQEIMGQTRSVFRT